MKISVIVPVHNAEQYVRQALDSLAIQTLDDMEVIVVLDAPTDDSPTIVKDYARTAVRFKVVSLDINSGLAAARQAGLGHAVGEFVGFLDADDWAEPDMFNRLYQAATIENADIASCAHRRVSPDASADVPFPVVAASIADHEGILGALTIGHSNRILWFAWRNLYRRAMLRDSGIGFDDRLQTGEDMLFNLQAFGVANKVAVVDDVLYNYRQTPGSLTMATHLPYLPEYLQLSYDLKLQAARSLNLGAGFGGDMNRYIIENTFPRLLSNAVADPESSDARAAVAKVLALPMVRAAVASVPLRGSRLPRGQWLRLALAKSRQLTLLSRLYRRA